MDWRSARFYAEPRLFYRYADDYIQGVPASDPAVLVLDPQALVFANVDARFYRMDSPWGISLAGHWSLDGVIRYVRGERDDISDNLYRIAPLNGRATLTYRQQRGWAALEGVLYADQDQVSDTNREQKSDGYGLLNLSGGIRLRRSVPVGRGGKPARQTIRRSSGRHQPRQRLGRGGRRASAGARAQLFCNPGAQLRLNPGCAEGRRSACLIYIRRC